MTADTIPDKASFFTKIAYGSGATAFGIKDAGFNYFILIYYNQVLGLDAFLAGLALALAVAIDAISDLLIGYISDHWRSRLGRRHPFMYGAVIPVALTFFWLWNPPEVISNDKMWLFFYLLTMAVLVRSCITFFEVPNAAQGPELTRNYDDRTSLMAFRYVFGWLGGLSMTVLTLSVLIPMDPDGQMGATGYKWWGITGSLAMFVMMIASALGTHQQISEFYKPSRPMHFGPQVILRNFTGLFSNRSFNSVFASSLFFGAAAGLSQALVVYVSTYFWLLTPQQIAMVPALGILAVPAAFLIAPLLAKHLDKRRAAIAVYAFAIGFMPLAFAAKLSDIFPANDSGWYLPLILAHYLIETTALISMQIIFASMNVDVVDDRSAETAGTRDEGLIFAARNFSKKAVSGIGVLLAGVILWLASFPEKARPEDIAPGLAEDMVLAYLPILLVLYAVSCFALKFYAIDRDRHASNLQQQTDA